MPSTPQFGSFLVIQAFVEASLGTQNGFKFHEKGFSQKVTLEAWGFKSRVLTHFD